MGHRVVLRDYSSPRTSHESCCSNWAIFSAPCCSYQSFQAEAFGGRLSPVISFNAMKDQLRIRGEVRESFNRDRNLGTMRIRCLRVNIPQSETLHPARSRTLSEASLVKDSNS